MGFLLITLGFRPAHLAFKKGGEAPLEPPENPRCLMTVAVNRLLIKTVKVCEPVPVPAGAR